ncbi:CaiB/BaiF CoA transferase family protein [Chloroflexota bacterium]
MKKAEAKPSALGQYRVLDMTDEGGVFCTKVFAALGADVIKIEPPGGDPTRRIGPFYHDDPDPEKSLHWFTYNLNKRSITLNIQSVTGRELFKRLVKTVDFVVECFRPGYLDSLGLGYSELSTINPKLILTSITPYGSTGPYSQFKGSNLITSAASGYLSLCGDSDRAPVQITTPVADIQTGLEAAAATLVAHWYRQRTGKGQHVDVSAQESYMVHISTSGLPWKSKRTFLSRGRDGAHMPGKPRQLTTFECKDGNVVCGTTIGAKFKFSGRQPFREWLASEDMAGDLLDKKWDPVFMEGIPISTEQRAHIDKVFQAFAIKHTKQELMLEAQRRNIQLAVVQTVRDVMKDPHLKEREYLVKVQHPELNDSITYAGAPFKSKEMSWEYRRRAPFIGEHNQEIYGEELGLSQQELAILKEGGVI